MQKTKPDPFDNKLPIVVDLDGTLIWDEVSHLTFYAFCRRYPWKIPLLPFWLIKGVAYIKSIVAEQIPMDPKTLNYNQSVLDFLAKHKDHRMILATGADQKLAHSVADYLGLFEHVIASDGVTNTISSNKAKRLDELLGQGRYIYLGNSSQDINVWKHAAYAVAVNTPPDVLQALKDLNMPYEVLG